MTAHALWVLLHALAVLVFINRYVGGITLKLLKGKKWDETRDDYEPTVTIVIPMFNEGEAIKETLASLLSSDYPAEKLKIVVVDDRSKDDSYNHARSFAKTSGGRIKVVRNAVNLGKRRSINRAVRESDSEIIVSIDSDVVVDSDAIRQLVRRFTDDKIAAVGGWVDVRNKHENWLSRMQTVKYWYSYYFMKNLEWAFRRVMCLSGCLTAYRRHVLMELEPILENREILGVPIKYGEDRFLTRQIVKAGYLTTMTLDARCRTFVPTTLSGYFSQQLRWRRSNIVDYAGGFSHVWRLNPVIAIHFFSLFALLLAYPIAITRLLLAHKFFAVLVVNIEIVALFGLYYRWRVRKLPKEERVGIFSFIPLSVLMPVTYAIMTPCALFTLDSGSWETRNHDAMEDEGVDVLPAVRDVTSEVVAIKSVEATAVGHAQLPAA